MYYIIVLLGIFCGGWVAGFIIFAGCLLPTKSALDPFASIIFRECSIIDFRLFTVEIKKKFLLSMQNIYNFCALVLFGARE